MKKKLGQPVEPGRSIYEQVLEQQYGQKNAFKTNSFTKEAKERIVGKSSSKERIGLSQRSQETARLGRSASPLSGSLTVEQRTIVERVFEHYGTKSEDTMYLRYNKFRKMMHELRIPLIQTMSELIFYGENKHQ